MGHHCSLVFVHHQESRSQDAQRDILDIFYFMNYLVTHRSVLCVRIYYETEEVHFLILTKLMRSGIGGSGSSSTNGTSGTSGTSLLEEP